jgi:hypothetical protein
MVAGSQLLNAVTSESDSSKRRDLSNQLDDFLLDESFVISVSGTAPMGSHDRFLAERRIPSSDELADDLRRTRNLGPLGR